MFISNGTFKQFEGKTGSTKEAMLLVEKLVNLQTAKILQSEKPKVSYNEQLQKVGELEN